MPPAAKTGARAIAIPFEFSNPVQVRMIYASALAKSRPEPPFR
jgi:hypothetical protein